MAGDLVAVFRKTLARIAELEDNIVAEQAEVTALRGEIEELRSLLKPQFTVLEGDETNAVNLSGVAQQPIMRRKPIRAASTVGHAKRVLQMVGSPIHVDEIITNIQHMTGVRINKATLVSNLSRYVANGDTFKRTGPNTFGLLKYDDPGEIRLVG